MKPFCPKDFKVVALRECLTPAQMLTVDTPDRVADYWRTNVATGPYYNPSVETFATLLLNTRRKALGHHIVATGTLDTILVHPRETFRVAILGNASAVILCHNHPSGDSTPSEADIKITRDLMRAGQLLKIEVLDHVIIGVREPENRGFCSLRELGYFYV